MLEREGPPQKGGMPTHAINGGTPPVKSGWKSPMRLEWTRSPFKEGGNLSTIELHYLGAIAQPGLEAGAR
jgi:hypothetical protein